jgi:large conductance mechanosensitive channel
MSLMQEFKGFISKGNVVDLAVAVVIGQAFSKIVSAAVEGLIMPLVSYVLPSGNWQTLALGKLQVGRLLGAGLDFALISLVVFLVFVKGLGSLMRRREEAQAAVSSKTCPQCLETVPKAATRCRACTGALEA